MTIRRSGKFKKDYKSVKASPDHRDDIDGLLAEVFACFRANVPIPRKFVDHKLKGDNKHCRECRLKPDLLLVYRRTRDGKTIDLMRLGSHSKVLRM